MLKYSNYYFKSLNASYHPLSLVSCMAWRLCRQSKTESTALVLVISFLCLFFSGTGCDGRPRGGSDPEQLDGSEGERERDGHPPLQRRWQADAAGAVDQKQPDGGGGLRWGRRASQQEQKKTRQKWNHNKITVTVSKADVLLLCLPGVILSQDNQTLKIQRVKKEDSGHYTCTACNRRGCDASQAFLTTEGQSVIVFLRGWLLLDLRKIPAMEVVAISLELIYICNLFSLSCP